MRRQMPSVRSAGLRSRGFSLAKTCSMGFRSGAVGRQEDEMDPGPPDCAPDGHALVATEVVPDHDVVRTKGRNQQLLDIGQGPLVVDRPLEDEGGSDRVAAQGGQEGQGLPMAVWDFVHQPSAP